MPKFVNVRVKKAGGGHRMQRAMVLASGKYKFVSNRGRSTKARRKKGSKTVAKRRSHAITKRRSYSVGRARKRGYRRRGRSGGGMRPLPFALAAAGIAYLAGPQGPQPVKDLVAKVPGTKTFGAPAMLGIACLAVDRFVKPNKWLKLAGYAGIAAAAMQVGNKGPNFQWVGDDYSYINDDYDIDDLGDSGDIGEEG